MRVSIRIGIGGGRLANRAVFTITRVSVYDMWEFKKYDQISSSFVSIPSATNCHRLLIIELKIFIGHGPINRQ
jgi:hypothetical protein